MSKFKINWGLAALFLGATGIGFAPILVRWSEVGPSATAGYRVLFSLPWLWAWTWFEPRGLADAGRPWRSSGGLLLAVAGALFAVDLGLWHWSLQFTTVANSTLLTNLAPMPVTLGAWLFFRERISRSFLWGLLVAFGGVMLLVASSLRLSAVHFRGDLLALATTLFYAGYLLAVKHLRRTYSTARVMAGSGLAMCPVALLFALLAGETLWPASGCGWAVLLALALISHVGGQVLIAYGLGHLPASLSSVTLLWQPVVAAVAAWVCLGERLTPLQVAGGVAVLLGIAIATRTLELGKGGSVDPSGSACGSVPGP